MLDFYRCTVTSNARNAMNKSSFVRLWTLSTYNFRQLIEFLLTARGSWRALEQVDSMIFQFSTRNECSLLWYSYRFFDPYSSKMITITTKVSTLYELFQLTNSVYVSARKNYYLFLFYHHICSRCQHQNRCLCCLVVIDKCSSLSSFGKPWHFFRLLVWHSHSIVNCKRAVKIIVGNQWTLRPVKLWTYCCELIKKT